MYPCIYVCLHFFCDFGERQTNWLRIAQSEDEIVCSVVWILPDFLSLTQQVLALVFLYQIIISKPKLTMWKDKGK